MKLQRAFLVLTLLTAAGCMNTYNNQAVDDYAGYSCPQLGQELDLVNARISDINNQQVQNRIVGGTMSMLGYDVDTGPSGDRQLGDLERRQDRLQHDLIAKNCYATRR